MLKYVLRGSLFIQNEVYVRHAVRPYQQHILPRMIHMPGQTSNAVNQAMLAEQIG